MYTAIFWLCFVQAVGGVQLAKRPSKAKNKAPLSKPAVPQSVTGRVAVLGLSALGLPEDMRRNLELLLSNSIGTVRGLQLIPPLDVQMLLQAPKNADLALCGGGPDCAMRIGKVAGADVVVFGTCAAIGDSFSLNLRAIAVATGKEVGRQNVSVSGSRDQLIPEVRLAAYRLLAPSQLRGALLVDTDLDGVAISVDGKEAGVTPLPKPLDDLAPGEHTVLVRRLGYAPLAQKLTIKPFQTTRLQLQLQKAEPEPEPPAAPPATPAVQK